MAGVAAIARPITRVLASAAQPRTPVHFDVPAGACDCHTHIIGHPRRFPFAASRTYTPETASVEEMRSLHRALHMDRVVVVQPTVYGADNSCMLDALAQIGPNARGIAVMTSDTSNAELDRLHRGGVRGIRIHVGGDGPFDPGLVRQRFSAAVDRIKGRGWHVELVASSSAEIDVIGEEATASTVPVSFDFGTLDSLGVDEPGFATLLRLLRSGNVYVNIAGPYLDPHVARKTTALIAANPRRITWGSNWPHVARIPGRPITEVTPLDQIDDGRDLNRLATWTSSAAERRLILVENPARLYGF
jgi:predicted TIM-barrel fold metal-dependent hydrolase